MPKGKDSNLKKFFQRVDITASIGLILKTSSISNKKVLRKLEFPHLIVNVGRDTYPDDVLKKMVEAFRTKKWFIMNVRDSWFSPRIYNQLRLLCRVRRLQILNLRGEKDVLDLRLPDQSRVVLIMNKSILEDFEIPNFLDLIGPVHEI